MTRTPKPVPFWALTVVAVLAVCLFVQCGRTEVRAAEQSLEERATSVRWDPQVESQNPAEDALPELRVAYLPATHDALLFIALHQKFFASQGVLVDPRKYANSPKALQALEAGEVDIAIPGIAAPIYKVATGSNLTAIGGAAWYSAAIVSPVEIAVKVPAEGTTRDLLLPFANRTIGTITQSTGDAVLRAKVREVGLAKDIVLQVYDSPTQLTQALLTGEVDAALLWSPHMTLVEDRSSGMEIALWMSKLTRHPCCRQICLPEVVGAKRDLLVRYMSALILAKRFLLDRDNAEQCLQAVRQFIPGTNESVLRKELLQYDTRAGHARTEVSPNGSSYDVSRYGDMMSEAGLINGKSVPRVRRMVDDSILRDAYRLVYPKLSPEQASECANAGLNPPKYLEGMQPVVRGGK